jgi:hypothetical protein
MRVTTFGGMDAATLRLESIAYRKILVRKGGDFHRAALHCDAAGLISRNLTLCST